MIFIGGIIQHGTYSVKALLHRIQKDYKLNKRDEKKRSNVFSGTLPLTVLGAHVTKLVRYLAK